MCGCNANKVIAPAESTYTPPESSEGCIITLVELAQLKTKLECFQTHNLYINVTPQEVNAALGTIQSMINIGDYCLYDLTYLKNRIENVTCT